MASVLKVDQLQGVSDANNVIVPGAIIQTQFGTIPATEVSSTANTYTDIGLEVTITPKVQTSNMLINIMFPGILGRVYGKYLIVT